MKRHPSNRTQNKRSKQIISRFQETRLKWRVFENMYMYIHCKQFQINKSKFLLYFYGNVMSIFQCCVTFISMFMSCPFQYLCRYHIYFMFNFNFQVPAHEALQQVQSVTTFQVYFNVLVA